MAEKIEETILKYIVEYYRQYQFYPNYDEIGEGVKRSSKSTVHTHMKKLESKGIVIRKCDHSTQYRIKDIEQYMNNQTK